MWPFKPTPAPTSEVTMTTQPIVVSPAPATELVQNEWRLGQITSMFEANVKFHKKFDAVRQDEFTAEIMRLSGNLMAQGMRNRAEQYLTRLKAAGVKI